MEKYNKDFLQILWVEDDPKCTENYPLEAAISGLQLCPVGCWDDAIQALNTEFDRWAAIILDAKCKKKKNDEDNAAKFLIHALSDIKEICASKKRRIPWYILSGGSENELNDLIHDDRLEWDSDWPRKYYDKNTEREILYRRIRYHVSQVKFLQIRSILYRNVFEAIKEIGVDEEVDKLMEDLLLPLHFKNIENKDYNNRLTYVRTCLEYIFRSMMKYGILPKNKMIGPKGDVNVTWCSKILAGEDIEKDKAKIIVSYKKVLPALLKDHIKDMLFAVGAFVHSEDEKAEHSRKTKEYLKMVDNSSYLISSFALQLCDLILWYKNYLIKHSDIEENQKGWEIIK